MTHARAAAAGIPSFDTAPDRWLGLDIRHLAALQAIAEEGSFIRAAQRLGYTQSAISQQLQALERIVGKTLVERSRGSNAVRLTDAGTIFAEHAAAIRAHLRRAARELGDAEAGAAVIRLGTFQTTGSRFLPYVLESLAATHPGLTVVVHDAVGDPELIDLLEEGRLDVAFLDAPLQTAARSIVTRPLMQDRYGLLVARESPLVGGDVAAIAALAELPLITYRSSGSTSHLLAYLRAAGVNPTIVFQSDDNEIVRGFVTARKGAALLPQLAADGTADLIFVPLAPETPPRTIVLGWLEGGPMTRTLEAIAEVAAGVVDTLAVRPSLAPQRSRPTPAR